MKISTLTPSLEERWESRTRKIFWIGGILATAVLTYTTRHFINGDAINYIEMGEAFRHGQWHDFVNLTASPGYAILLGLTQLLLDTNPLNEIPLLKIVNFALVIAAMGACDFLLLTLRSSYADPADGNRRPLPWFMVMALAYAMCLFCTLVWVSPKLVAPETATFATTLVSMAMILRIRQTPERYSAYIWLGVSLGLGYVLKTFFFSFSAVLLVAAAVACGSIRKAVPRLAVTVIVMLMVCSPWIIAISAKLGRVSIGETGALNYAIYVKGEGKSSNPPLVLNDSPQVLLYKTDFFEHCSRPATFDPSYWRLGIKPVFQPGTHLKLIYNHALEIILDKPWLTLVVLVWGLWNISIGALRGSRLNAFAIPLYLAIPSGIGILMYSMIHVEMRYIAPFIFLIFMSLLLCPRYDIEQRSSMRKAIIGASLMLAVILVQVGTSVVDQSIRDLISGGKKLTYLEAYRQLFTMRDFLAKKGVQAGTQIGLVNFPPMYWARMSGLKVSGEIPDKKAMLEATPEARKKAFNALRAAGVNTLVGKGKEFAKLTPEGWELIPNTRDFYVLTAEGSEKASPHAGGS